MRSTLYISVRCFSKCCLVAPFIGTLYKFDFCANREHIDLSVKFCFMWTEMLSVVKTKQ